jgi:hypothetical protein
VKIGGSFIYACSFVSARQCFEQPRRAPESVSHVARSLWPIGALQLQSVRCVRALRLQAQAGAGCPSRFAGGQRTNRGSSQGFRARLCLARWLASCTIKANEYLAPALVATGLWFGFKVRGHSTAADA